MPFTAEELRELALWDAEIEREFRLTREERTAGDERDRRARLWELPERDRKIAEYRRAYYEENREKIAEHQRAYYEENRERLAEEGAELRRARRAAGYTQRDIGRMLGVNHTLVCHWELGRAPIQQKHRERLLPLLPDWCQEERRS